MANRKTLGIEPVLRVALEKSTAFRVCELDSFVVLWNAPQASYSLELQMQSFLSPRL